MKSARATPSVRLLYDRGMATAIACWEHSSAANTVSPETTGATGMSLDDLTVTAPEGDAVRLAWRDYQQFLARVGVPAALLSQVDATALDVVDPERLATALLSASQGGLLLSQVHGDLAPLRAALDVALQGCGA